jgi:spermidine synthase
VIIADFPDPSNFGLGKLYAVPMYRLMKQHLSETGILVVQSTSPYYAPRSFWCIEASLKAAGFFTYPYHAHVPSFGEWGYILAKKHDNYHIHHAIYTQHEVFRCRSTRLMFSFPPDMQRIQSRSKSFNNQMLVHYFEQDWGRVIR